jgi:hypothetical protein
MTRVHRLWAVGAFFGLGAVITCSHVWGDPTRSRDFHKSPVLEDKIGSRQGDADLPEHLAVSKFADNAVVRYAAQNGDNYIALQIKPELPAVEAQPRDYLIAVSTTATQAGAPLATAKEIAATIIKDGSPNDRFAIWTINVNPKDLTKGFQEPKNAAKALGTLNQEYGSGATDLVKNLTKAATSFEDRAGRQQVIVYLGSGASTIDDNQAGARSKLCSDLVQREIAFYPIPLGSRLDPKNLHTLSSGTGGTPIRMKAGMSVESAVKDLHRALEIPVFYPTRIELPATVKEFYPAKLPPLRADVSTLLVARIQNAGDISYEIKGTLAGNKHTITKKEALPESEKDNFFLTEIVNQWRGDKDAPAMLAAERVLDRSFEQHQLARLELVAQADEALNLNNLDAAQKLFKQAELFDPEDPEAKTGAKLVDVLKAKKLTKDDLIQQMTPKADDQVTVIKQAKESTKGKTSGSIDVLSFERPKKASNQVHRGTRQDLLAMAELRQPAKGADAGAPAVDPLEDVKRRQQAEDQRVRALIDESIRRANSALTSDPDAAHESLKRTLDGIRNNPDLSDKARQDFEDRLTKALRYVDTQGVIVKRQQAERMQALAQLNSRRAKEDAAALLEERIRERLARFHDLMNQGRALEANKAAQLLREDLANQGVRPPVAVTAAYRQSLITYNLREVRDLERRRQERFLATLLEVERSAIPFPDEPPVEFPPAATWRALTALRKEKYENSGFATETPRRMVEMRNTLNRVIKFEGINDPKATLGEFLESLSDRYDLTFEINEQAFKAAQLNSDAISTAIAEKPLPKMAKVTLSTLLRKVLSRIPNSTPGGTATYIIRPDVIEITTVDFAVAEKSVRVYPVADLVIPIPNSFNQQSVQNQSTIFGFGGSFGLAGASITVGGLAGGLGGIGGQFGLGGVGLGGAGLGGLGGVGLGGGLGGIGLGGGLGGIGLGGGLGGLGGVGLGGGIQGGLGGQIGGLGGIGLGGGAGGGGINLGVGGGQLGLSGGQLGQFGNLGGQFGLQGGDDSRVLIQLIRSVVGTPKDWATLSPFDQVGRPGFPGQNRGDDDDPNANPEGNNLGFYPPSMALVVKGTSTMHARATGRAFKPIDDKGVLAPKDDKGDRLVIGPKTDKDDLRARIDKSKAKDETNLAKKDKNQPGADKAGLEVQRDPLVEEWQDAMGKSVDQPWQVLATADFLVQNKKFEQAAKFLKANLKRGILVEPYVYEALSIALKETGGSKEEIERADLSSIDLQPLDANGYLKASQTMTESKRYEYALAFCQRASSLEPNMPQSYAEALDIAEAAKDATGMTWAAQHLLLRDWPINNQELHDKAKTKLDSLAKSLTAEKRLAEAEKLTSAAGKSRERDLVIRANWGGTADVDLKVKEPSGSVCSCINRQTVGGGILIGDNLSEPNSESYVAAQAFSGVYEISVDRVWGTPVGDKVQIQIVYNQGTPRERTQVETITLKDNKPVKISLDEGRRTSLAQVAPRSAQMSTPLSIKMASTSDIIRKLRNMAEPSFGTGAMGGSVAGPGKQTGDWAAPELGAANGSGFFAGQNKVNTFISNGADLSAQAVISSDRRSMRVSLSPVFNTVTRNLETPVVSNPFIPGGN